MAEKDTKKKTVMTNEERLELAAKLDNELDEFINSLPKSAYKDGWPEDRWEEEMEKHPFFMTKLPEPGAELNPLYEGLQQLKYDPDENSPEELAKSYKEDGNYNFKYKNYRLAVLAYTEGIKAKCGDLELERSLLNNRASAHFYLKNYRSSLRDCELALKIDPNHQKSLVRAAKCCFASEKYQKCIEYCDRILETNKINNEILELKNKCQKELKIFERNKRKKEATACKKLAEDQIIIQEIIKRKIKIRGGYDKLSLSDLEPVFPQLVNNRVHLDLETGSSVLVWPVVFLYPEYKIMDYIITFRETDTFIEHLLSVFQSTPEWDSEKKYVPGELNVYFEDEKTNIIKVDINECLGTVLSLESYVVQAGTPSFMILVNNSPAEKRFLEGT